MNLKILILLSLLSIVVSISFDIFDSSCSEERGRGRRKPIRFDSSSHSHEHRRRHRRPSRPQKKEKCEDGWLEFDRPNGKWCIKVFTGAGTIPTVSQYCVSNGAILTGFQNNNERMKVADEALRITQANGQVLGGMWVAAREINGIYQWTDGVTTGFEAFKWGVNEPGNNPPCVQQFIIAPAYWANPSWTNFQHGDLDNFPCTYSPQLPQFRMYACGKRAVIS